MESDIDTLKNPIKIFNVQKRGKYKSFEEKKRKNDFQSKVIFH